MFIFCFQNHEIGLKQNIEYDAYFVPTHICFKLNLVFLKYGVLSLRVSILKSTPLSYKQFW